MNLMRSFARVATATALLLVAAGSRAEPVELRMGSAFGAGHTSSKAMEIFKAEVTRRSRGAIDVGLFPDMQLGGAKELIDDVRAEKLFATWVGIAFVSRLVPEVDAVSLPFVFQDYDHAMHAVDGTVGKLIEAKLSAKGFTTLAWMELGARHVTNSQRPLRSLEDFKGLRIRLQPNETHMAAFRAFGANPVAMDIKDVYAATKQGDIDGEENPYSVIDTNKYFETQKYLSDSGHVLDLIILIANKKSLAALSPEQQKAIRDAARIAALQQRKMAAEGEAAALNDLIAKGMQFDPLPAATRAALRKATAGVIDSVRKRVGNDLVNEVVAEGRSACHLNGARQCVF
jgi:tripartite ATP-independent transporter DctP family solute receptor